MISRSRIYAKQQLCSYDGRIFQQTGTKFGIKIFYSNASVNNCKDEKSPFLSFVAVTVTPFDGPDIALQVLYNSYLFY